MIRMTKPQRRELLRRYQSGPLTIRPVYNSYAERYVPMAMATEPGEPTASYREVRQLLLPTFGCDGAVLLPIHGYFLGIEADGYAHS